ncbi:uncharacterized protein LOC129004680 [Macrosteles quadrilineatus]|uniref:uncharacterized protein LOC129004680 n=1 Tax=Macrosteles quadrilineatus TaxID=74068 RepID=UPI0023E2BE54|nr:uncharacterized protein LOC129004680 [Macrosteles quadrilineatus]
MEIRKVENKTRRDRIRNVAIRNTLDVKLIATTIQEQQLKWFGHVHGTPTTRIPKIMKEVKVEGKCKRGRPRRKLEEEIEDALCERGSSIRDVLPLTADRKSWRLRGTLYPRHQPVEEAELIK